MAGSNYESLDWVCGPNDPAPAMMPMGGNGWGPRSCGVLFYGGDDEKKAGTLISSKGCALKSAKGSPFLSSELQHSRRPVVLSR